MSRTIKALAATATLGAALALSGAALAAEPIVGSWKTSKGETAAIAKCGGSYCITVKTGEYAGKRIGRMSGSGKSYSGTITDPSDNKKYSGTARVNGASLKLKGCALKIFCKTQNWKRR